VINGREVLVLCHSQARRQPVITEPASSEVDGHPERAGDDHVQDERTIPDLGDAAEAVSLDGRIPVRGLRETETGYDFAGPRARPRRFPSHVEIMPASPDT
jgi:hypothetical protein